MTDTRINDVRSGIMAILFQLLVKKTALLPAGKEETVTHLETVKYSHEKQRQCVVKVTK